MALLSLQEAKVAYFMSVATAVLPPVLLAVTLNATVLAKFDLTGNVLIGLVNGVLAAALLFASIWRPHNYVKKRLAPIILMRLLVGALPLFSDIVGQFGSPSDSLGAVRQVMRATFMLLVGISWAVGLFIATFLLLPPVHHLAAQTLSLALVLNHNRAVCTRYLEQHPSHAAVIDSLDATLRALAMSLAPSAQLGMSSLGQQTTRQATCVASAAAIQVSLGFVLPTLLAWQLQSRMAASIAARALARRDAAMAAELRRSQHVTLCVATSQATKGHTTKLLLTGGSMLVTYTICLLLVA